VTSAELMAQAAISEGKYAQAFPSFGPERRGAPVQAFNRIDSKPNLPFPIQRDNQFTMKTFLSELPKNFP